MQHLRLVPLASLPFIAACASVNPSTGFHSVSSLTSDRIGATVHWNQGTSADSAVTQRINALLADSLTADAAVQIALLNNRSLQATYEELGIAQADLVQAGLLHNPLLSGTLRLGLQGVGTGYEVGIVQEFLSLLQIPMRKRVAAASYERVKLTVANEVLNLAARTREAFYTLQAAEQTHELLKTVTEATQLSADIARRQHEAGNISDLNFMNEQALYEQTKLDLARAHSNVLEQREVLSALMGVSGVHTEWTITNRLPDTPAEELPLADLETAALNQRLDLAAARQEIIVAAQAAGLTRFNALVPEFETGVSYEREPHGEKSINPSLGIRIPVFDQGQALKASARARIRQAQERYAALAVDIRAEVRRLHARLNNARSRAEHLRNVVIPLRTKIVDESQLHYNGMFIGAFQLLQAKRDQIAAGQQYVEVLSDYWITRTALERAVGGRLPSQR
jgi:cobalt-zinc-cadmium efflux system outer membrane protein